MHSLLKIFCLLALLVCSFINVSASNNRNLNTFLLNEGEEWLSFAEEMPAPVGGLSAVYKNITYPEIAKRAGVEGKVYVMVFIDETGAVADIKVLKGIGGGCDEAACDAIKKAKFTPGKNQGVAVKVKLSLPVNFKLK